MELKFSMRVFLDCDDLQESTIAKINNKYRNVITIKCKNNKRFRNMISAVLVSFMKDKMNSGVNVVADINPLS